MAELDTGKTGGDGRVVHPVMVNTVKDGTGTWLVPIADVSGRTVLTDGVGDGIVSTLEPVPVTVGTAVVVLAAANPNREFAYFKNISNGAVDWSTSEDVTVGGGIDQLAADGGWYEMSRAYHNLYRGAIYAIASAENKTVLVTEGAA